jgi:hypothetical protein
MTVMARRDAPRLRHMQICPLAAKSGHFVA